MEKLLRTIPDIGTIYILIRKKVIFSLQNNLNFPKEGSSPMERFKKVVLGTACFDRLRKIYPNFDEFVNKKIVVVGGDVVIIFPFKCLFQ